MIMTFVLTAIITKGHDTKLVWYKLNMCVVLMEYIRNGQINYTHLSLSQTFLEILQWQA